MKSLMCRCLFSYSAIILRVRIPLFACEELQQLSDALASQFRRLKFGGRAVVITFKPREDRGGTTCLTLLV